jgi:2-polyprenyl-3-methyl-5-hydroxy-6-metoxy-1,4-benzoquinol methylase
MDDDMDVSEYFDGVYAQHDRYWWREPGRYSLDPEAYPTSLLTQQTLRLLGRRPTGRALDLGAGEGSDAIRLALLGYDVDAVEISTVAAEKIQSFAAEVGVKVRVIVADIQNLILDGLYDVVTCNGVLHYVRDKASVISHMQGATCEGGINVVSLWSTYTPVPECHDIVPVHCDDEQGMVADSYRNWAKEFIYFDRDKVESAHSDLPAHRHSHLKLIATKREA